MIGALLGIMTLTAGEIMFQLENYGFFRFYLPMLLIFALVYVIMSKIETFKDNNGAVVIIALTVAILSMQFVFVSDFFSEIFPRFGAGLAILLIALILIGAITGPNDSDQKKFWKWITVALVIVLFGYIVLSSTTLLDGWSLWYRLEEYLSYLVVIGIIGGAIFLISRKGSN